MNGEKTNDLEAVPDKWRCVREKWLEIGISQAPLVM